MSLINVAVFKIGGDTPIFHKFTRTTDFEDESFMQYFFLYGDQQMATLADAIRAALMLRYNDRTVG